MEFKAGIFTVVMLAIVLSSPAMAQKKSPPAPPAPILPPSPAPAPAPRHVDLADLLSVAGPFHTFLDYLQKTNVIDTFQNQANNTKEGITIFVPTDSAFAALKKTTFANLTKDQLKSLILYHAFPKYYSLAEFNKLSSLNPVATFAGSGYTLNLTDNMGSIHVKSVWSNPKISSSVYSTAPVAVYEVNKVLLPMQIFKSDPPLAPAPAPAPDAKASDVAPSPTSGKSASAKAKAEVKNSSHQVGVGIVNYLVLAVSGGLMLLW
ncbi:fasciclin-like arabinogalactan protein 7 [Phragmites australis]|uniref:fasciclin-like arabinogalactan protein 7 n=1 Tax=Phragmites australis TaxID=29695 RepID=UPI002D79466C|nr:fasciclin-like arabinogalactan protein 7 [Phragmites australis]